jgi:hypothetical protein
MKTSLRILVGCTLLVSSVMAAAAEPPAAAPEMTAEQKAMMEAFERMAEVRAEHKQLAGFVGRWSTKTTMFMDPSAPPETSVGKVEFTEIFGGRSYEMNYQGSFAGEPMTGRGFLGFDNLKKKFYSTWMDSMSTGIWIAYGTYDAASKAYTFRGEMDNPMKPGETIAIRQVWQIKDADHFVFEWYETEPGAAERKSMWIEYTRAAK